MQLMHGELCNIASSLRAIANRAISGTSRGSAADSIQRLLNTDPAEDEDGQLADTCSRARQHAI